MRQGIIPVQMRKEIIVAILLGLSLGLFITYGLYRTRSSDSTQEAEQIEQALTSSPEIEVLSNLVVHSPEDESIVNESDVTVAGDTEPDNFVVIFINDNEYVTTADDAGAFSISGQLETGSNVIQVYSLDEDGNETVEERVVIYTTQPLTEAANEQSDTETTDTEDPSTTADEDTAE